ncbi:hypothetical protein [Anatilimnocola floriformis]|uniref:hypothetical protein n=1 Tax=Anatilimnocola floriformis TaxID=2948575 RepID=UPI0020C41D9C|nr:hypothetical protein [Anatilimnocola floriformis]
MSNRSLVATGFGCAAILALLSGCGDGAGHVSGKVTFGGKPIPAGKVLILPDGSKGNTGVSGFADIKDGVFDTKLAGGHAASPGAVTFAVEGIDLVPPPNAPPDVTTTVLFPRYEEKGELPAKTSTKDIDVPLTAAQRNLQTGTQHRGP